ncbi:PAS domain S-box protein [Thalassobaculum sp.]|uniref:PAS domain S-box protein n=1 Tax=Thalassobaculum sp. TaxID=2022740 RepID=UPI0032F06E87
MDDANTGPSLPVAMTDDIVDSSRDAIITIDPKGRLTSFNPGAEAIFGLRASETVGKTVAEVFLPIQELDVFTDCVLEAVRNPDREHTANISLDGENGRLHLSVRAVLLRHKGTGDRVGVLVMISDESERVESLAQAAERERERAATGRFIVAILTIFSVFTLLLEPMQKLAQARFFDLGPVMALLTLVVIAFLINRWISPSSETIGLLRPQRRHLVEAVAWSVTFCVAMTLAKYAFLALDSAGPPEPLFSFYVLDDGTRVDSVGLYALGLSVYLVSVPFQQFAVRCAIQAPLQSFLTGVVGPAGWIANVTATLLFAVLHAHLNPVVSLAVILPSLLWGWLFMRSGSVVTPIVSHAIIGVYAIFVLGVFAGLDQV